MSIKFISKRDFEKLLDNDFSENKKMGENKMDERKISINKFLDLDRDEFFCGYYTIATKEEFQRILSNTNLYKLVFDDNLQKVKKATSYVKMEWAYPTDGLEGLEGTGVPYIIIARKIK